VANGTAPLSYQWQKGTTNIQNAISSSYTTPATTSADNGSQFRVVVTNAGGSVTSSSATLTVTASAAAVDVLTYHNDIARTGANTNETMLTTSNVATATFGKIGNFAVDAKVDAQPLYASNVSTSSGTHNLLMWSRKIILCTLSTPTAEQSFGKSPCRKRAKLLPTTAAAAR